MINTLSKSKIMTFHQCPKRLWLELHHKDLMQNSTQNEAAFTLGHAVGNLARALYDKENKGLLIDLHQAGITHALNTTQATLELSSQFLMRVFLLPVGYVLLMCYYPIHCKTKHGK